MIRLTAISLLITMGQSEPKQQMLADYHVLHLFHNGNALLRRKKDSQPLLLRLFTSSIDSQINDFEGLLRKRMQIDCPHLIQIIDIQKNLQKGVCSKSSKLYFFVERPSKSIYDAVLEKKLDTPPSHFTERQLWGILYSCAVALDNLYSSRQAHQGLCDEEIYVTQDGTVKISDPLVLGYDKNYIVALKNEQQSLQRHISPQIINFLQDSVVSYYNKALSDVFILGMIMLETSLLRKVEIYDMPAKQAKLERIKTEIVAIRQLYSQNYCTVLQAMLQINPRNRLSFTNIIEKSQCISNIPFETDPKKNRKSSLQSTNNYISTHDRPNPSQVINFVRCSQPCRQMKSMEMTRQSIPKQQVLRGSNFVDRYSNHVHYKTDPFHKLQPTQFNDLSGDNGRCSLPLEQYAKSTNSYRPQSHNCNYKTKDQLKPSKSQDPIYSYDIPEIRAFLNPRVNCTRQEKPKNKESNRLAAEGKQSINKLFAASDYSHIFRKIPDIVTKPIETVEDYKQSDQLSSSLSQATEENRKQVNGPSKNVYHSKIEDSARVFSKESYSNGDSYEGYKVNDLREGYGKLLFENGSYYEGQWMANKMHGYGKLYNQEGNLEYEGEWKEDSFNGKGKLYYNGPKVSNGPFDFKNFNQIGDCWEYYDGEFKENLRHGKGKIMLSNGEEFQGQFADGCTEGEGMFLQSTGERVRGVWRKNLLQELLGQA